MFRKTSLGVERPTVIDIRKDSSRRRSPRASALPGDSEAEVDNSDVTEDREREREPRAGGE